MKAITCLLVFMITSSWVTVVNATDLDNNGVDDYVEETLIEKFKPAFVLHRYRIQEPEPVQILNGNLDMSDLWVLSLRLDGTVNFDDYVEARFPDAPVTNLYEWPHESSMHNDDFHAYHFEYGNNGFFGNAEWRDLYINGNSDIQPGSYWSPVTYAHVYFNSNNDCMIQYWFFYPYNDWAADHEGDWEHIDVRLNGNLDRPDLMYIESVAYYFHKSYQVVSDQFNLLSELYILDSCHPVVFVGGFGEFGCVNQYDYGHESGGSYPCYGLWVDVGAQTSETLCGDDYWVDDYVELGGKFIHYDEVLVKRWPRIDRLNIEGDESGCGEYYFSQHSNDGWMRGRYYWGQPVTYSPWAHTSNPINEEFGNIAPISPPYQSTWECRYPEGWTSYQGQSVNNFRTTSAMVFVSAYCDDRKLNVDVQVSIDGSPFSTILTPGYMLSPTVQSRPYCSSIELDAPPIITNDEGVYYFLYWENICDTIKQYIPNISITSESKATDIKAIYGRQQYVFGEIRMVADVPIGNNNLKACDFNGDLIDDFILNNSGTGVVITYISDSVGGYTATEYSVPGINSISIADVDNDGDLDILANRNIGNASSYLINNGMGDLIISSCIECLDSESNTIATAWADFNGDGVLDIAMLTEAPITSSVILRNSTGDATYINLPAFLPEHEGFFVLDYNNDGLQDILLRSWGREVPVLLQNNYTEFVDVTGAAGLFSVDTAMAALGDIDNDGDVDIISNETYIYDDINHQYSIADNQLPYLRDNAFVADFNNDSYIDACADGIMYCGGGSGNSFSLFPRAINFRDEVKDFADIDNDGDIDAVVISGQKLYVVLNRGNSNNYVKIRPVTAYGNQFMIGQAVVNGAAYSLSGLQYDSNDINEAHVGLGQDTAANITIQFYPNCIQQFEICDVNRTVFINESQIEYHSTVASIVRNNDNIPIISTRLVGCPAGDGTDELVVIIDFDDTIVEDMQFISPADIEIDLESLGFTLLDVQNNDTPGTQENGYTVTIRRKAVSGCSLCQTGACTSPEQYRGTATVRWRGEPVGRIDNILASSPDIDGDGNIDLSDLSVFSAQFGLMPGDSNNTGCADLYPDGIHNLNDLYVFSLHYGHHSSINKNNDIISSFTKGSSYLSVHSRGLGQDEITMQYEIYIHMYDVGNMSAFDFVIRNEGAHTMQWRPAHSENVASVMTSANSTVENNQHIMGIVSGRIGETRICIGELLINNENNNEYPSEDELCQLLSGSIIMQSGKIYNIQALEEMSSHCILKNNVISVYPNPLNPTTNFKYNVFQQAHVRLCIYDTSGRIVKTLVDQIQAPSIEPYNVCWNGADNSGRQVPSSLYLWRLSIDDQEQTGRVMVVK